MINVTEWSKNKGIWKKGILQNFLRMQRVKSIIANGEIVQTKAGRYGGCTFFSEGLFNYFEMWLRKEPLPLLNRTENEVNEFIKELFGDEVIRQHKFKGYIFDWYIPSLNLLIEFNEKNSHQIGRIKAKDEIKKKLGAFMIEEISVSRDLARLTHIRSQYLIDSKFQEIFGQFKQVD